MNGENPSEGETRESRKAFLLLYTEINLRRVRWVLAGLVAQSLSSFLFYAWFSGVVVIHVPREKFLCFALAYGAMWAAVEWALRRGSPRARVRVAGFYYVFGCVGAAALAWQSQIPVFYSMSLMAFCLILIVPPRLSVPLLAGGHALFLALLFQLFGNHSPFWENGVFTTICVVFAGYVSTVLYNARHENFRKEQTILRQVQELETANVEMGDLMAITAHNLGSPLQGLANLLELVRLRAAQGLGRDDFDAALDAASQSCGEMIALVRRLLDAHSAEHAGDTAEPAEIDLAPHFLAAARRAGPLADAKKTTLALQLPPSKTVFGLAQPALLGEVLDNLLSNAVKYAPGGTTVTLALRGENGVCRGEVRDEGPGILERDRPQLFSKFFNGENKPTGGETSTGLGLFIVQKLMEGMGGRTGYEPGTPKGGVFWLEVPAISGKDGER